MRAAPKPFLLAQQLARAGRLAEARIAYARSVDAHPDFLPGYLALGGLVAHLGDTGAAIEVLRVARARADGNAAARHAIRRPLADLLATLDPQSDDPALEADLLDCLGDSLLDLQPLARVTATLLLRKPDAAGDPLWIAFLTRCINTHPAMEARLIAMRDALLATGDAGPLLAALALQSFANQHVWPEPARAGPFSRLFIDDEGDLPDGALWRLLADRRDELRQEAQIATAIPGFGAIEQRVSAAVQSQYEDHPYPRWQAAPASRRGDFRHVLASLPRIDAAALPPAPLKLLVAGCGTGYEAIDLARTDSTLSITAIDLSRTSLAFARRKADELGVSNLRLLQGDILALDQLGERFDAATSTGVLHHMADPDAGLASIARSIRPGGVLRLALYSRRARAPIRAAHALIAEHGWRPDKEGIRAFRTHILSLPQNDPLAMLRQSDDFYTLSGCRDLVFHVHERHYGFAEIAALIAGAGLSLVGFEASPEARARFDAVHGAHADLLNLDLWDQVEAAHPFLFAGMIHFWCQKPT